MARDAAGGVGGVEESMRRTGDAQGDSPVSVVASTLMILTCLVLGLLAGGMLVIGVSLVGFWKSLSPSDFQAWFASHAHLVGRVMIPLGPPMIELLEFAVDTRAGSACPRP